MEPAIKLPNAFGADVGDQPNVGNQNHPSSLRFVPLSTNPIRFPDPTPSEPLSQFTLEHALPGSHLPGLFNPAANLREEPRKINGNRQRGRVINPVPIKATPLPPLNEIDELHAPRPKGIQGVVPSRQPVANPNPALINTVQNDFVATTPSTKTVIGEQQPIRVNRPFNLQHPFQTSFDQFRILPNVPQPGIPISQRPRQPTTTPAPVTVPTTTTTKAPATTTTTETTTSTAEAQTISSAEEVRKQRIRILHQSRKPIASSSEVEERPRAASPKIRNKGRGRIISKTRVRRPINSKKSRRPQIIREQQTVEEVSSNENLRTIVDRRPVPLPKARGTEKPAKEEEELVDFNKTIAGELDMARECLMKFLNRKLVEICEILASGRTRNFGRKETTGPTKYVKFKDRTFR